MANRSKILNPEWFYDKLQNALEENIRNMEENLSNWKSTKMRIDKHPKIKKTLVEYDDTKVTAESYLQEIMEERKLHLEAEITLLRGVKESKPFLMGGATLESLINSTPEDYSCVREGRLPFDNMFFEFAEPITTQMPFLKRDAKFRGMKVDKIQTNNLDLSHTADKSINGYLIDVYFEENAKIYDLELFFSQESRGNLEGRISELSNDPETDKQPVVTLFSIDRQKNLLKLSNEKENRNKIIEYQLIIHYWKEGDGEKPEEPKYEIEVPLDKSKGEYEFITKIPNLTVNFINYINAHNVTVVRKEREVIELQRDERNKKKKVISKHPFYLITVKDHVYEEPDTPRETGLWTLKERVFVRGHWKYYRDKNGQRIGDDHRYWVIPHIRGPHDAPFKETRYQVLHDKLKREQEMYNKYGVHQYSSDLTMPGSSHNPGDKR
jgi:hypothetical protein